MTARKGVDLYVQWIDVRETDLETAGCNDHAIFQSWNGFGIRLGSTEVVMQLRGLNWRVTALEERAQDR